MLRSAFVLLLVAFTPAVRAGVLTWTTSGPETGQVTFIRFDPGNPDIVWAGTAAQGVFKSTDGGQTWTARNEGLIRGWINTIAVDPTNSSTVYLGNEIGNVYKTSDGGATWTNMSSGLFSMAPGPPPITALAIDPRSPSTLYAATTSRGYLASLGVQKSTNGGQSWSDGGANGLGTKNVFALAIDPQNPSIVYAGGFFDNFDRPLFKTTTGGTSWVAISNGITGFSVNWIAPDPLVSGTVFIITSLGGVSRSTNGGTSWIGRGNGLSFNGCTVLVFEKNSSTNLWCGSVRDVYRTTDGGASWSAVAIANERIGALDVSSNGTVVAGSPNTGLYRRAAGGSTWMPANSGFLASQILALAADPVNPGVVYAGTNQNGLFKSTDHGRSWTRPSTEFNRTIVRSIVIDPKTPNTLYLGTGFTGFYKSIDGGAT
ncbi:MAG TPA: hypothetical protein VJB15_08020, partial [Rhodothermia bacterium]|nr:hypothetical protein [Rhodothermia bacterium]